MNEPTYEYPLSAIEARNRSTEAVLAALDLAWKALADRKTQCALRVLDGQGDPKCLTCRALAAIRALPGQGGR